MQDQYSGQSLVLDDIVLVVIDDVPVLLPYKKEVQIVDEDDIRTDLSDGTSPNDGNGDGSYTGDSWNNGPGPATVTGSLAGLVKIGADEWPSEREQYPAVRRRGRWPVALRRAGRWPVQLQGRHSLSIFRISA